MRIQFWNMSEDSIVEILLRGSSVRVCLVVLNQVCCGSSQYNLPDKMLRLVANTTLNQSYILFITLVNTAYQSEGQCFPFIHCWDSDPWKVLYIPLFLVCFLFIYFLPTVVLSCFLCSACISKTRINLSSFLFS